MRSTPKAYGIHKGAFDLLYKDIASDFREYSLEKRQSLGLIDCYVDLFLLGKKKTTIRYTKGAIDCPSDTELDLFKTTWQNLSAGSYIGRVLVDRIVVKAFDQIDDDDAHNDGFTNKKDLRLALERIYGRISPCEPVTIYWIQFLT